MKMYKIPLLFLLWTVVMFGNVRIVAEICRGIHCLQIAPSHYSTYSSSTSRTLSDPFTEIHSQHQHGSSDNAKESVRTRISEVFSSGCAGPDCVAHQRQAGNDTRECKGIECKLPLRIRPKPRPKQCVGEGCVFGSDGASSQPTLVHMTDRAAQFLGEFPDLGYPASELGGAPLGVQLTCDIKPGENEVPSEDALILQLQLAKGQEKLVEALRAQQTVLRDLQQRLVEQQGALVSQQREILEQQRRMYEQMDLVKVQFGVFSEAIKQMSFQGLQGDVQGFMESHLQGLRNHARSHMHKSYAVHKVDMDAKLMDVGAPLRECGACGPEEYCNFQMDPPQCKKCTVCPPGFFLVSQCSLNTDRICQDRDECLELPNLCGDRVKCLNTPGGFRCLGISERDASAGRCGHDYFYNQELQECQACSDCEGEPVVTPCSASSDTLCGPLSESRLSRAWTAAVAVPPARAPTGPISAGLLLDILGNEESDLLFNRDGRLAFRQHGLIWADHNFALRHSCRNFLQVSMRLNGSEEGWDLSGVRIEQPDGKHFQSVSVSSVAEVEPSYTLSLLLKSPNQYCNQSKDLHVYELSVPFSLFWLSHDTGAVAMMAQTAMSAHYQTNYRPAFKVMSVSDPYVVGLSHDGRAARFAESGVVKFVFQQALYSMGQACVREGFSLVVYANQNGTNTELTRAFKSGVNYRDTSISLSGAARVDAGDMLSFEILSPAQCNVRYFGDSSGISMLSLLWIPSAASSCLTTTVSRLGLATGAVRNKALHFQHTKVEVGQVQLVGSGPSARKNFIFWQSGVASVAFNLKLIHSCNMVKVTLHQQRGDQLQPVALVQQVGGHMPDDSEWVSVELRASFEVHNGTMISVTLDCVRGRINQIAHEGATNISILWVAS